MMTIENVDTTNKKLVKRFIDVGRIVALENKNFNNHHGARTGQFYFFDYEEDSETACP